MTKNIIRATVPKLRQDLTLLFSVGLPLVLNNISSLTVNVADTLMASAMGPKQLAAVALGSGVWISLFLFGLGILMAVGPSVAQLYGRGEYEEIKNHTKQSFWLALAVSFCVILVMRSFPPVFERLGIDPEVADLAQGYLNGLSYGVLGGFFYHTLKQMSEGVGETIPIMIVMLVVLPVNVFLNFCLMNGKLGVEAMGAAGCGVGSGFSLWLMFFLLFSYTKISARFKSFSFPLSYMSPDRKLLSRLFKLGLPIGLNFFLYSALFSVAALMMGTFGTEAVAAHQIVLNFSGMVFMLPLGLGMALTICVGQLVGRADLHGAIRIGFTGILLCLSMSIVSASLTLCFAEKIIAFYTKEPAISSVALSLLKFAAFFQVGDAVQTAAAFSLRGIKDTRIPMILNGINYWVIGFGAAYFVGIRLEFGPAGIWFGIALSLVLAGLVLVCRFYVLTKPIR